MSWLNSLFNWGTGSAGTDMEAGTRAEVESIRARMAAGDPSVTQTERNKVKNFDLIWQASPSQSVNALDYLGEETWNQARKMASGLGTITGDVVKPITPTLWAVAIIAAAAIIYLYLPRRAGGAQ